MFRRKMTRTRPNRNRLIKITRRKATRLRWVMFIDRIRRALKRAHGAKPHHISRDIVAMNPTVESQQHGRSGPNELLQPYAR
jgi:hypothetical protein